MASVQSLGISVPSAITYLVSEGILPSNPASNLYRWQTYPVTPHSEAEEELLITEYCVVWSRAGVVQKSFRFEIEKEPVTFAVIANFKNDLLLAQKPAHTDLHESLEADPITVRKQRRQRGSNYTAPGQQESTNSTTQNGQTAESHPKQRRAIVVLLTKQLHVFFVDGSSHLVHLPFSVQAVFPLPDGILLQRHAELQSKFKPTPQIPSAPANSFAFSQFPSSGIPGSSFQAPSQIPRQDDPSQLIQNVINSVLEDEETEDHGAYHAVLRDTITGPEPLLELSDDTAQSTDSYQEQRSKFLDADERLIYVSDKDELPSRGSDQSSSTLLLALTVSLSTGHLTLWRMSSRAAHQRKRAASKASQKRGARMSFSGAVGAATPNTRESIGPRDTMGLFADTTRSRRLSDDDLDIASQLDPAFENPRAPAKSSRRVSSLLARSDLHSEAASMGDLASSQSQVGGGARRGPSFGGQSKKPSYGSLGRTRVRGPSSSFTDQGPALSRVSDEDETMYDSDASINGAKEHYTLDASLLQGKEYLVLSKLRTFPINIGVQTSKTSSIKVFTIHSPAISAVDAARRLVVCVMVADTRQFISIDLALPAVEAHRRKQSDLDIRISNFKTVQGVRDADMLSDKNCTRIVALAESASGDTELSISSPWNQTFELKLPRIFLAHNPFDFTDVDRRRRDGSFKRVLSDGPDEILRLQSGAGNGQLDLLDSKKTRHRLQVRMLPRNTLVSRAIQLCESVIPLISRECQPLLRVWWDMKKICMDDPNEGERLEWKLFVASVFVFYVRFLENLEESKPARSKRKGGLLRSSSGANVDLESFDTLMAQQCSNGGAKASWVAEDSWSWLLREDLYESPSPSQQRSTFGQPRKNESVLKKSTLIPECVELARQFQDSHAGANALGGQGYLSVASNSTSDMVRLTLRNIPLSLHLLREELKLDVMAAHQLHSLTPVLAQIGTWLGWPTWGTKSASYYMLESQDMDDYAFDRSVLRVPSAIRQPADPPSILQYVEDVTNGVLGQSFPTLQDLAADQSSSAATRILGRQIMPRTSLILQLLQFQDSGPTSFIRIIGDSQLDNKILETLPEGVAAPLHSVISSCQANPGATLPPRVLGLIDRPDLTLIENEQQVLPISSRQNDPVSHEAVRDFHTIATNTLGTAEPSTYDGTAEIDRVLVTRLIFQDDQRFAEAARILHPLKPTTAKCEQERDWSDVDFLEAQQEVAKIVAMRTLSVSPGRAMLTFNGRHPLITEKFPIHGFSLSCVIKPSNTTVTADKSIYTEEKVSWAFFHAGVEAGLSISKDAKGIDTSWIGFNKPAELQNRHAGFMLALGLNGHLKTLAKWFAFKSFTAKHTMTSIGLLLGLAASFCGTMDTQITRLISVHVARLLPPNSAELNLSPMVQTAGMLSLGLLYCNSQHRRMSEIMLSEIESEEQEDIVKPMENLRDEGYRTAAGFALGFINVGQGHKLKALRDMRVVERLLALATATKRVEIVHMLDKATAAAVIATALIFMKTGDVALAKKIDIPDTIHQFEYVRPDIFLLRTVARHLIMWKEITPTAAWIRQQLPPFLRDQSDLDTVDGLRSDQLPLLNIVAGLCLAIGLRFAGSARTNVRDLLANYLHRLMRIVATHGTSYEERLTRTTARNCQDIVALAAATVMAGTGDIELMRYFRVLHGRCDPETHFGSHMAAHQALGALFLGGGTHTFTTSNTAIASILCSFYPLFPTSVLDNKCHLQAFRHLWVLAVEPRCLIVRAVETHRPVSLQVRITLISGLEITKTAPCLLPELDVIARITADDVQYWPSSLDFVHNPKHLQAFKRHQSLFIRRRRGAFDAGMTVFSATTRALNARHCTFQVRNDVFEWVFSLASLAKLDHEDRNAILPAADGSSSYQLLLSGRGTAADDWLALERGCLESHRAERLWSLRLLFAWEDKMRRVGQTDIAWLGRENIESLRAAVALYGRKIGGG